MAAEGAVEGSKRLLPPLLPLSREEKKPESSAKRARVFLKLEPPPTPTTLPEELVPESVPPLPVEDAEEEVEEEAEEE